MQRKREAIEKLVYPGASLWPHARTGGRSVVRPKKYHTQEERREARRQSSRKHYLAHREAITARQVERARKRRAAIKAGQKET